MEGRSSLEQEEKNKLAATFRGVTASTQEEALFFLESHDWILESAILSFYDNHPDPPASSPPRSRRSLPRDQDDDPDDQDEDYVPPEAAPAAVPVPRVTRSTAAAAASPSRVTRSSSAAISSRPDKKKASKPSSSQPTIRTLADLNRSSDPGSDSDSDGPQEYYTGGEKSGMLVQDPSKGSNDVDSIFEKARQMGATQGPVEPQQSSSSRSFTGIGRLLSGESVPSAPASQQPESIVHNICFWRNGFTVNDGPLRRFDDPENASFLESIRKSECPKELEPPDRRSAISVTLTRKEENCPEPVKRRTAFQGAGRTLGGGSSDNSVTEIATLNNTASSTAPPSAGLSVDDSLPSTSIQLRLADGTRMVARFNTHHTVGDIRAFIDASRPGSSRTYQLQTVGFPPKPLNDYSKTIEDAGLANSVIIQKG